MLRMRLRDEEAGMSLAELMVTMSVFSVVVVIFLTTLATIQRTVVREDADSVNNDQARLAMLEMDREIRSGNVLYDPAAESPSGFVLRIYTQSNANTRTPSPGYVCRLWQITSDGKLQTRSWPPSQPDNAGAWITVATGIVNRVVSPAVTAFSRSDPTSATGGRIVYITLLVNNQYSTHPNETVRIQQAITGRNTSYGFPADVCSGTPT
jgi:prepilin-type N-terminal cleavage/methylation domain-containing protein